MSKKVAKDFFRSIYPYDEREDTYLPSYKLIREHVEREKLSCLVMSPNGVTVGILVGDSWFSIH